MVIDHLAAGHPDAALPAAPEPAAESLVRGQSGTAPMYSRRAAQTTALMSSPRAAAIRRAVRSSWSGTPTISSILLAVIRQFYEVL